MPTDIIYLKGLKHLKLYNKPVEKNGKSNLNWSKIRYIIGPKLDI